MPDVLRCCLCLLCFCNVSRCSDVVAHMTLVLCCPSHNGTINISSLHEPSEVDVCALLRALLCHSSCISRLLVHICCFVVSSSTSGVCFSVCVHNDNTFGFSFFLFVPTFCNIMNHKVNHSECQHQPTQNISKSAGYVNENIRSVGPIVCLCLEQWLFHSAVQICFVHFNHYYCWIPLADTPLGLILH